MSVRCSKRITVYPHSSTGGQHPHPQSSAQDPVVLSVSPDLTLTELYSRLQELFDSAQTISCLYNGNGAKICDIDAIRDDELLFLDKIPLQMAPPVRGDLQTSPTANLQPSPHGRDKNDKFVSESGRGFIDSNRVISDSNSVRSSLSEPTARSSITENTPLRSSLIESGAVRSPVTEPIVRSSSREFPSTMVTSTSRVLLRNPPIVSGSRPPSVPRTSMAWGGATGDWITLNVGGKYFMTTRSTLTDQVPDSMLARMFSDTDDGNSWHNKVDVSGAFLIDRSPKYFEPVLNYLRHGQLVLDKGINPQGVLEEAKFFGIEPLIGQLEALVRDEQTPADLMPVSRRELILKLMATESSQELRCQGVNFTEADLSKLDLRHVNFKYAILRGADLSSANLSFCNFERADLSQSRLDGANLQGAKMVCVSLEGASMCTANFEDPAGCRANMEGANMKNVNLENSHMSGVNLRVANLKNANLQNCDLRGAVLAGADLENCNLSGCDLQEANLRGANLKGAAFELMLNPLHMAQTVR